MNDERTMAQTVLIREAERLADRLDECARAPASGACPDHRIVVESQALSLKLLIALMQGGAPTLPWTRLTLLGGGAGAAMVAFAEFVMALFRAKHGVGP